MMPAINEMFLAVSNSLAGSIVAKVTISTAVGLLAAWLARGSRAAVRHTLLAAMFGVILLLPLGAMLMPPLHVRVPVGMESQAPFVPFGIAIDANPRPATIRVNSVAALAPHVSRLSLVNVLVAGWGAGVAMFLLPVLVGLWQIRSLRRSGLPWRRGQSLVESLALCGGKHRRVEVLLHEALLGPMTCGVRRPAIILPRDAENWNQEDLDRAIVHELEHVRRGDSVSRCIARFASAIYWFHPMVWLAWRRLVLEAERSCDDAVLTYSEATAYADQLVDLAKRLSADHRSPLLAMASRSDLATRVGAVLDKEQRRGRAGKFPLVVAYAASAALLLRLSPLTLVAMPQETQPAFEVTSVKPNKSGDLGSFGKLGGSTVTFTNQSIKNIILNAYQIRPFQLLGGPSWINSDRFDIEGKVAGNPSMDQRRLMAQRLLKDRFRLALHRETREFPIFELAVAKNGLKLQPLKEGSCLAVDPNNPALAPGKTHMDYCGYGGIGRGMLEASSTTMTELATSLSWLLDRTVVDRSGITGTFRIHLTFMPDQATPSQPGLSSNPGSASVPGDGPDIFTALQEQLGLRLDASKGPVEVLVIDHVEKPTGN